ncbi:hypothetical protein PVIIG_05275 [Plasmodium vivax India VII]|uniref:Uncharacterized protein n=1 Tax=Plasmodium vivax India VII TaxID=1077284 RepID=A0A0J9SIY1_PLAVI|nr:hypothetical protein PVIIG_05275 [Plasmodium vivax India VII]
MNGNEKGNVQIDLNKDIPDSVKNIKNQAHCSFKNNRKSPLVHKRDENKYMEKEKCEMNNTNEYKPVYEHIENDTQGKDNSSKNKNKPFLFKFTSAIDSYFERIIFNVFSSIDKFRNNKSSNKFILARIALIKISLVFAIPISFIVMICHMALKIFGGYGSVGEDNYLYIVFISIGSIMIIYLLIKVLKYSCSKKKGSAI